MGIMRLSDQINIDKWAMLVRGLYSDKDTSMATQGILQRSLRIGQTDTDVGFEAIAKPSNIPQHLRSLLELMEESGYYLRKAGNSTLNSPSLPILQIIPDATNALKRKLMNYRITTLADLMIFHHTGNTWNQPLCNLFPAIIPLLPNCPEGQRELRIGQYWASSNYGGQRGRVVEIMGTIGSNINGRSWVSPIPSDQWITPTTPNGHLQWVTPMIFSDSRGAGATETFDIHRFFNGQTMLVRLSEEIPHYRVDNGRKTNCIARAVRTCHWEQAPTIQDYTPHPILHNEQLELWDIGVANLFRGEVEVFTDGSMRFSNSVVSRVLTPPESQRQPVFAQGGILFHFGKSSAVNSHDQNITISIEQGLDIELLLPSSTEVYSILLAARLMQRSNMTGVIYTDYAEATRINSWAALRNMGRKANLPIYETLVSILEASPGILIQHVKAHGPIQKQPQWTRAQWGNYYADRIAKGHEDEWADHHIRWPMREIESIVMQSSRWHWITKDRHLLLEPLHHLILHKTLDAYLLDRDIYRVTRGVDEKWQTAHLGYIADVWKTSKLKLGKLASANRLIWDRGWHGGNKSKTICPTDQLPEEWIGCGACGLPDSQNHWLRECQETTAKSIRCSTIEKVREQLDNIHHGKGPKTTRRDIFNICSEITEFALHGEGGEQVWVGILPEALVKTVEPQLPRTELPTHKMQIPNQWRTCITRILTIFKEGAQQMWQTKEAARCQALHTTKQDIILPKKTQRKRQRNQDIRVLLRRAALKQAQSEPSFPITVDIDNSTCDQLLDDHTTAPIQACKRLIKTKTGRALKGRRTNKHRWTASTEQEYFRMTRGWSNTILTKLTGKGPAWRRTIRAGTYNITPDMDWLDTHHDEETEMETDTEADKMNQNNGSNAVDHMEWQRESNEIASTSRDNIFSNNEYFDIASSRDGVG
jgi:hypothetical protein